MTRHQKVAPNQPISPSPEEDTGANEDRTSWPLSYSKVNLPYTYFSGNQSMLQELVTAWNNLFKRRSTP